MTAALLLSSTSLFAVMASTGSEAQNVNVTPEVHDGKNGKAEGFFTSDGTPGTDTPAAIYTWTNPVINGATSTAFKVGSTGGKGGVGTIGVGAIFGVGSSGAPGGKGGDASAEVYGPISGRANHTEAEAAPLLTVYSVGGTGGTGVNQIGAGGTSGDITLKLGDDNRSLKGSVSTTGDYFGAIVLRSEGGKAGAPLANIWGTTKDRMWTDAGGHAGNVLLTISKSSSVTTSGKNAPAIFASSIGGEGGNSNTQGYAASHAGYGGVVAVENRGTISTRGEGSSAIMAQSVGGRGGNAGRAIIGGALGGQGGSGGRVQVGSDGTISTDGNYSFGIMAQSVSGAGGTGGSPFFSSGGQGGDAGLAGSVSVMQEGIIKTLGKGSTAIFAQSVGGAYALDAFQATTPVINKSSGGGAGGQSGVFIWNTGGIGGAGGNGGSVDVVNTKTISTFGDEAYGVLAQSVGGGGGTGGGAATVGFFVAIALGGTGGDGGNGGSVLFKGDGGTIETSGYKSTAVLVQSVGGGGGTGGTASATSAGVGASMSSAVGGTGGGGGGGGPVKVDNSKTAISTFGNAALGIQAISIGGGGGVGGGANAFAVAVPAITPSGKSLPSVTFTKSVGGAGGGGGNGAQVDIYNGGAITTWGTESIGIQALSVGGGGGNGGDASAYGLAIAAPGATALTFTDSVGGGGGGGSGSWVKVDNAANVQTYGYRSVGILAQSIGGGGGNAGAASASADGLSLYRTIEWTSAIGGKGGGGGSGENVVIQHNQGLVETWGDYAIGLYAESIGGGGGNGGGVRTSAASGLSFDKTLNDLVKKLPLADAATLTFTIGGSGGNGGNGGSAEIGVRKGATVRTYGAQSDAVFAQSVGGGGGSGGGGSATTESKFSIKFTVGGSGGAGGSGGSAKVTNDGVLETYGDAAYGIYVQSVGGGGGSGGNMTADQSKTPDRVGQIWTALKGAVGVKAYEDWAADKGNAQTKKQLDEFIKDVQSSDKYKYLSDALKKSEFYKQMQSFGKNITDYLDKQKKNATKFPDVSLTFSMGGSGGAGNKGGDVTVQNTGTIHTYGDASHGIFAQSVGGGGGQGGVAYASGTNKTNLSGTLGGSGGDGNLGGILKVDNSGQIWTDGDSSYGIFAQSVGGGGGVGVGALSSGNKNLTINLTVGGNGGKGGKGSDVRITNSGTILTLGKEAHGIVAQSVGGGGGAFIMNPANVAKTKTGDASDEVDDSTIMALLKAVGIEQVPPASGDSSAEVPKKSGSFVFGGSGGSSGEGGLVAMKQNGTIETRGEAAFGILAQSVGGGGGISNAAGSPGGVKYAASYGGSGGSAGSGGNIEVSLGRDAAIYTSGKNSTGLFAQSVGGGGGYGGASTIQGWTLPIIGGAGGSSGNGGTILIGNEGSGGTFTIKTTGEAAHGVFAQSLGGGGGAVSNLLKTDTTAQNMLEKVFKALDPVARDTSIGTVFEHIDKNSADLPADLPRGDFDSVVKLLGAETDTVGTVISKLKDMLSQRSASTGTGGQIRIDLAGTIVTSGANSFGIFAQSGFQDLNGNLDPSRKGGDISIRYSGTLTGGSGDGAAIGIDGGSRNTIFIGKNSVVSALSGKAILATFGSDRVDVEGKVIGDVDLSVRSTVDEVNSFFVSPGGTYQSNVSGKVNLGKDGDFKNDGFFDIAGKGVIGTATVSSRFFTQGSPGVLAVDVTSTPAAGQQKNDVLKTTGEMFVNGKVQVNVLGGLRPDTFRIATSEGTMKAPENSAAGPAGSPFLWTTRVADKALDMTLKANFVPVAGVSASKNQQDVMKYLQNAWNVGAGSISDKMANTFGDFARVTSAQDYMQGINSIAPDESSSTLTTQTLNARASMHASLSCPVFEGSSTLMEESNCAWARIIGTWTDQTSSAEVSGYNQSAVTYRVGVQREVIDDWFVGVTAGFTQSWLNDADGFSSTEGNGADAALSLKHQIGPWLFALSGHLGFGNYQTNRIIDVGTDIDLAEGTANVLTGGGRFRASYEFAFANWYVKPYADFDVLYTYMPAYQEQGIGTTLDFSSAQQWNFAFSPNVEIGGRLDLSPSLWLRPYGSVGMTFFAKDSMPIGVSLSDASDVIGDFMTEVTIPSTLVNLSAGVQLFDTKGYEVRAEYKADIGDNYLSQELSARFAVQF